jgi:hypothetical protein
VDNVALGMTSFFAAIRTLVECALEFAPLMQASLLKVLASSFKHGDKLSLSLAEMCTKSESAAAVSNDDVCEKSLAQAHGWATIPVLVNVPVADKPGKFTQTVKLLDFGRGKGEFVLLDQGKLAANFYIIEESKDGSGGKNVLLSVFNPEFGKPKSTSAVYVPDDGEVDLKQAEAAVMFSHCSYVPNSLA